MIHKPPENHHMNLNDPFQRVGRKRQRTYEALRDNLLQQGVRDYDAALMVSNAMSRNATVMSGVVLFATVVLVLIFPNAAGVVFVFALLAAIWIGATFFQARMHLKRYMLEECRPSTSNADTKDSNDSGDTL